MRLILIFLILGLVSGCSNPFSIRMSADYFPLEVGYKWIYQVEGQAASKVEIEVISYDTAYLVNIQGLEIYMERREGEVNLITKLTTTYRGERILFGTVREPYLHLPFIKNDYWEMQFKLSTVHNGDTIYKSVFISVDSVDITTLSVPFGNYDEVYHLRRIHVEDEDSVTSYEWYAPNVGLIRKVIPSDSVIWELENFTSNE